MNQRFKNRTELGSGHGLVRQFCLVLVGSDRFDWGSIEKTKNWRSHRFDLQLGFKTLL